MLESAQGGIASGKDKAAKLFLSLACSTFTFVSYALVDSSLCRDQIMLGKFVATSTNL